MFAFSQFSRELNAEALAWGCVLPGPLSLGYYIEVNRAHLALALLTCEGPGKRLLEKLGVTLETEVERGSVLARDANEKLDQLPGARAETRSLKASPLGSFDFHSVREEAKRMGSDRIEPFHCVLALIKQGWDIPVRYHLLCEVLDSSGNVKESEALKHDLAEANIRHVALKANEQELRAIQEGLGNAMDLVSKLLSPVREKREQEVDRMAFLSWLHQRSISVGQ